MFQERRRKGGERSEMAFAAASRRRKKFYFRFALNRFIYRAAMAAPFARSSPCTYFQMAGILYIMPRLYIGKQYWKAYDNRIKAETTRREERGARKKLSEGRRRRENNGVSHHFIYKIKVPFMCHEISTWHENLRETRTPSIQPEVASQDDFYEFSATQLHLESPCVPYAYD